jgi:hypothetical protein
MSNLTAASVIRAAGARPGILRAKGWARRWCAPALGLLIAGQAQAQSASGNGFLFREPEGSFSVHAGYSGASAGGDLFSFATSELTLKKSNFSGFTAGAEATIRISPRLDFALTGDYAGVSQHSEFRNLEDQNNQPIEQVTDFRRVPLTAAVRAYLMPRGRSIGRFVWIPSKFSPWVEAGGGVTWYQFQQHGDFVDYKTNDIFHADNLTTDGWAPTATGAIGADVSLSPRFAITGAARYIWARHSGTNDFSTFDRIDLSGVFTTLGFTVRL